MIGAIILIIIGVFLLLGNFGIFGPDFWSFLLQFWPLILIAFGLDIVLGRKRREIVAIVIVILVAVLWFVWAVIPHNTQNNNNVQTAAGTQTIMHNLDGAHQADITLNSGMAKLYVSALDESGVLVRGTVDTARGARLTDEFKVRGGVAQWQLASHKTNPLSFSGKPHGGEWRVQLSDRVPLDLTLDTGVGNTNLDLAQLNLTRLSLDSGVGSSTITMPASGQVTADINGGVGSITVRIPRQMSARIKIDKGLGGVHVSSDYLHSGDTYTSADYGTASNRLDLSIDVGIGSITIEPF